MKHFKESEFHNYGEMNAQFIDYIDNARDLDGYPWILHSDYRSGENQGMHGEGRAIDFHKICSFDLLQQAKDIIIACEKIGTPFRLGVYPYYPYNPGFHLDNKNDLASHFWIQKKNKEYFYYDTKEKLFEALENELR
jgi:hypothetical protein